MARHSECDRMPRLSFGLSQRSIEIRALAWKMSKLCHMIWGRGIFDRIGKFGRLPEPNHRQKEWERTYEGREFSICCSIRDKLI
jgi:hypothetical protein